MALRYFGSSDYQLLTPPTIYHRSSWGDAWVAIPYLYARNAQVTTGNAIGRATLSYEYGEINQHDTSAFATYTPLDIIGDWIKIEWTPGSGSANYDFITDDRLSLDGVDVGQFVLEGGVRYEFDGPAGTESNPGSWSVNGVGTAGLATWYGIATDQALNENSERNSILSGTQTIECHSVEWLLTRQQVTEAYIFKELSGGDPVPLLAKEGLIFNPIPGGRRQAIEGNRYLNDDANGVPMFAKNHDFTSQTWHAGQAIRYLVNRHPPVNQTSPPYSWKIQAADFSKCAWHQPENISTHGQTLQSLINQILPRSRGFVWWVEVDEGNDEFNIRVDTVNESDIVLPGSSNTVVKNANQVDIDYDLDAVVGGVNFVVSSQRQYEQVIVEGARRGVLCTLELKGTGSNTAEGGYSETWDSLDRVSYNDGFSNDASYAGLGSEKQKQYNEAIRKQNPSISHVYSVFNVDANWDRRSRNGNIAYGDVDPKTGAHESPLAATEDVWIAGIRLQPYLPIFEELNYNDPSSPSGSLSEDSDFERMLLGIDPDPENSSSRRVPVDKLGSLSSTESSSSAGSVSNARVVVDDSSPTFRITSQSMPNHVFAHGQFTDSAL